MVHATQTTRRAGLAVLLLLSAAGMAAAAEPPAESIRILFLGDDGHHRPAERFAQLRPVLARRGIELTYTDKMADLNPKTLAAYDGLLVYANTTRISPEQEKALLDYVAGGGGFIPLHCASYCFLNSDKYVELVGAQFRRHGTGVFRTTLADVDHPVLHGFGGFESWDETYVHTRHNEKDRTVLSWRVDAEGREPWTWVRTHGQGRVFYTAWGHDARTWGHAGFQNLVERGIRWAVGADPGVVPEYTDRDAFPVPRMTAKRKDVAAFEYVDVGKKIPNYTPSRRWGTQGEPLSKMQQPLPPEESLKHMVTPEGFRVELFASEADFGGGKPICMTWDEAGRLWVALTLDYPNELKPPGEGRDRIVICEDTDGDRRADKTTVFAEGLSIPTSIALHRGGAIVQNAYQTLYLKDTDGDDRADERRVLFSGWGVRDTHGVVSNFQYGLDNWIWAMQGYNPSRPVVAGEPQQGFRQGFFRFRPDGSELEFIRSTDNNTWGLGLSEEGLVFGSTANHNPSVHMPIANRYYESVRGWTPSLVLGTIADTHLFKPITDRVRQVDQHGGYTAGAGHALYTARAYPREYWNRTAFVNGPTGHLVGTFVLSRDGAGFRSRNLFNLLASDDEWTAPIMAEVGPDGHVWVIDWYNYIVQHNPTPQGFRTGRGAAYETDLRDKKHGRVYRVVCEASADVAPLSLKDATPEQLVAALANDNLLWRRHAQRLLVERGRPDVVPALVKLAADESIDEIGLNVGAIHALWTLHGVGALDGEHSAATKVVVAALRHRSAGVRLNAARVLPRNAAGRDALLEARLLQDADAQVRLAALLALSEMPADPAAGEAVLAALREPRNHGDRWLADAATAAAAAHDMYFLQAVAGAESPLPPRGPEVVRVVAEHCARGGPADSAAALVASLGGADPEAADAVVTGLAQGWPQDQPAKLNAEEEQALVQLLEKLPAAARPRLVRLAAAWNSTAIQRYAKQIAGGLLATAADSDKPEAERTAAAAQLVEFQPGEAATLERLLALVTPRTPPAVAEGIVEALGAARTEEIGPALVARLPELTPRVQRAAVRVLLGRAETTRALLEGLRSGQVRLSDLTLEQKQALVAHPDRRIARAASRLLEQGGGLPNVDRQKVLEELLPLARKEGDPAAGKQVFTKQCSKCHMHSGEGKKIGPDLTGMAVHPKEELLVHLIDPSRNVEGNYRVYTVVTDDGRVRTGLLAGETKTSLELFDSEGKQHVVLRDEIEQVLASPKSLMPEGFEKQVSPEEIVNLLEYLTQRGKFLPLDLRKVATIVSTRGMFFNKDARAERLIFSDWSPKEFAGVPFHLVDPQGERVNNVVLLYGPQGNFPPRMPKSVRLPCNAPARAIHLLSGVSGWGFPLGTKGSVSMIVRLHYADGGREDHELRNGEHFADYIRRVDVPDSELAFMLRGQQIRYLSVQPKQEETIKEIELLKGPDRTAPVVMAVTVETR